MTAHTVITADVYRPDPRRPGYCWAWKLHFERQKNGAVTKCQDGERFYARKSDAEFDAEHSRRHADKEDARLFGPLTVEVREVYTAIDCVKTGAIHREVKLSGPALLRAFRMPEDEFARLSDAELLAHSKGHRRFLGRGGGR